MYPNQTIGVSAMEVSPLSDRGRAKLHRLRSMLRHNYAAPQPSAAAVASDQHAVHIQNGAFTPRSKVRHYVLTAARMSSDEIFAHEFGAIMQCEMDPVFGFGGDCSAYSTHGANAAQSSVPLSTSTMASSVVSSSSSSFRSTFGPSVASSNTSAPLSTSSYSSQTAAPSTNVGSTNASTSLASHAPSRLPVRPSQLMRPTRIRTPKKILSLKRTRTGECSAEKRLPLRKPRILASGDGNTDFNVTTALFGAKSQPSSCSPASTSSSSSILAKPLQPSYLRRPSPSKLKFLGQPASLNATRQRLVTTTRLTGLR